MCKMIEKGFVFNIAKKEQIELFLATKNFGVFKVEDSIADIGVFMPITENDDSDNFLSVVAFLDDNSIYFDIPGGRTYKVEQQVTSIQDLFECAYQYYAVAFPEIFKEILEN